jgi:hypothetical protein
MPCHRPRLARAGSDCGVWTVMRALLLAMALGACTQPRCDLSETHGVSFTSIDQRDSAIASATGADCGVAQARLDIKTADGAVVYSARLPVADVVLSITPRPKTDDVRTFLETWSSPSVSYTALAPPWRTLTPANNVALDRDAYAAVRSHQWRMICPLSAPGRESCVYWDPTARRALRLYDRATDTE